MYKVEKHNVKQHTTFLLLFQNISSEIYYLVDLDKL